MTLNLSPYDRETAELADAAGTELGARVRAVMAARNNAEAKIARVDGAIRELLGLPSLYTVAEENALRVVGLLHADVYRIAADLRAALDGSGVTPE